ncbi:MAG: T9SS type A sorting domain-containing protein [bacterium]|nr:T9SS type A sorting domain-containing protein [bacterium]
MINLRPLIITLLLISSQCLSSTFFVPSDFPDIQSGINAAISGDTVVISSGLYYEYGIIMKEGVTLTGDSENAGDVTITADNHGRIIDCSNLSELTTIKNITFDNGYVSDGWISALGAGVRAVNSNIAIHNCTFINNTAFTGAGFGALESTIDISDCTFMSNRAVNEQWAAGGAIWAKECTGNIRNCEITQNTAFTLDNSLGDGGGFFFNNCQISVFNSRFVSNSTAVGAGGFYSVDGDASIFINCYFAFNEARTGGAVYYEYGASAQFLNCVFFNNIAVSGGAIYSASDSSPHLNNCDFLQNIATLYSGGAFDCWGSDAIITDCRFVSNRSENHAGGINFVNSTSNISGTIFQYNSSTNNGGAIRCYFGDINLLNCTLASNSAANGGGIFITHGSSVFVDNSIIAFSTAGESIKIIEDGFATISCSNIFGNSGGDWVDRISDQLIINNNLRLDPMFDNTVESPLLLCGSPCSEQNNGECGLIGALPANCDITNVPLEIPEQIVSDVNCYPNPFNPSTTIQFSQNRPGRTSVAVYDISGQLITTLIDNYLLEGTHQMRWNGDDSGGNKVASGNYFFRITSDQFEKSGRLTLLK